MSDVGRFTQLPEDSLGSDATDSLIEDDRGIPDDDRLPSPSPSLTRNDPVHRVTGNLMHCIQLIVCQLCLAYDPAQSMSRRR